jgi:endonuclease YncB( thermonuclease family)
MHDPPWARPPRKTRLSLFLHTAKLSMVTRLLLTCFVLLLFPYSALADFTGPVVSVLDGDTLEVLHDQHPERIRLNGIDCPEKGQAYGKGATAPPQAPPITPAARNSVSHALSRHPRPQDPRPGQAIRRREVARVAGLFFSHRLRHSTSPMDVCR